MSRTTRSSTRAAASDTLDESQILPPDHSQQAPVNPPSKRRGRPPKPKLPTAAANHSSSTGTQPDDAVTPKPRGRPRKAAIATTTGAASDATTLGILPSASSDTTPTPAVLRPKPRPVNRSATKPISDTTLPIDIPENGSAHKRNRASIAEGAEPTFDEALTSSDDGKAAKKTKTDIRAADQVTKPKPSRIIPPRSPLPQRINRVQNPGKPDVPRAKRTSDEVAAELETKENLLKEIEELRAQKLRMVAEREIEIELAAEKARQTTVMHLTDLDEHRVDATNLEDEMDVDGDGDEMAMNVDLDLDVDDEDGVQDLKGKKPAVSKRAPTKVCGNS